MKVLPNSFKNFTDKNQYVNKYDTTKDKKKNLESNTLRGYLLNNNIKKATKTSTNKKQRYPKHNFPPILNIYINIYPGKLIITFIKYKKEYLYMLK